MTDENGPLWALTARESLARLAAGEVTPLDLVTASLTRIDEVNPRLNAVVDVYRDEALAAAARLPGRRAAPGRNLAGVPVTIKDNIESRGHVMSEGVVALAHHVCRDDAPLVTRLRRNGAVITGRTNCPPHCWQLFSTNELYGATINPVNPDRTPGGSSGGAAASVASGMVPIAQGNDIAGSIRYPAYACAVVGLRPTNGLIPGSDPSPADKPFTFQHFASQGVLARTVDDAYLGFDAMRGYAPGDPVSLECAMTYASNPRRVGVYLGEEIAPVADEVGRAVLRAAHALEERGWAVDLIETDVFRRLFELEIQLVFGEFLRSGAREIAEGGTILQRGLAGHRAVLHDLFGDGYRLTLDDYVHGLAARGSAVRDARKLMERYPILLTPVSAEPPFARDEDQYATAARGREMAYASWPMDALPAAGLPGLVLPTDVVADGIGLGVQLVARAYDEATLRRAGADLETYFGLGHGPVDGTR